MTEVFTQSAIWSDCNKMLHGMRSMLSSPIACRISKRSYPSSWNSSNVTFKRTNLACAERVADPKLPSSQYFLTLENECHDPWSDVPPDLAILDVEKAATKEAEDSRMSELLAAWKKSAEGKAVALWVHTCWLFYSADRSNFEFCIWAWCVTTCYAP